MKGDLSQFVEKLREAKNATLLLGAGISIDAGIPAGYQIPMRYGEAHQDILKDCHLYDVWESAKTAPDDKRRALEYEFSSALIKQMTASEDLQRSFLDWLSTFKTMAGAESDTHAAFVIAWFNRVFNHLVTTNWDFLLEYQGHMIYDEAYLDPFESVTHTFSNDTQTTIASENLFFLDNLEDDDYFWHPRWDIVAHRSDLDTLERWTRPIWKIHGSPFFLQCPQCGGFSRWKYTEPVTVGDACPEHPEETLKPEIIYWGSQIDKANANVWKRLKGRLRRSDMVVACGFSGGGSDEYIRTVVERNDNVWLINPTIDAWDSDAVTHVEGYASDLANILISEFLKG